ncbi:hypothetical protein AGMMS49545_01560 [Betaproteobacteria bacterium]|nr:hypothetical protein AGMMS49545_01560 [Betaproteobacteria bacterium]GHU45004.1 hypothetical protein AGMMS50289_14970 [Betaproteobacteria bacterium]
MQDFSSLWQNYLEYYQRSLQDIARLWVPNLPTADAKGGNPQFDPLSAFSPDAWSGLFAPWLSQGTASNPFDAASNPFAGFAEATQASLKAFAPWTDALAAFGAATQPTKTKAAAKEDKNLTSAERAVNEAIKRSKTQDI